MKSLLYLENKNLDWEIVGEGVKRKILGYDEKAMMVKVEFENGAIGSIHKHYHTQVTYIAEGSFEVTIGNEKKILSKGDGFFVPSNIDHGVVCLDAGVLIDTFSPMRQEFLPE